MATITYIDKKTGRKARKEIRDEIRKIKKRMKSLGATSHEGAYIDGNEVKSFIDG